MKAKIRLLLLCLLVAFSTAALSQAVTLIRVKGSDSLVHVARVWAEEYERTNRDVAISVGGGGTGTGFHAMLIGAADLVNASRRIDPTESDRAGALGMAPVKHIVGFDALAVYLHQDNPLQSLTFAQLSEIFGRDGKIKKWTDLGVEVPGCSNQEIVRAGRQNNSGTHAYFRAAVFGGKRRYDLGILDMLSSKDVVHLVQGTPCAIGYSGLAYATPAVKMACVAQDATGPCVAPSIASAADKSYPIARPLYMYSKVTPRGWIESYLNWILSDEGQCILKKNGYAPVRALACD